jgi:hypothetical protein
VTRLPVGLAARGGWADTVLELPPGRWRNVLDPEAAGFPDDEPTPALRTPRNVGEEAVSLPALGNRPSQGNQPSQDNRAAVRLADLLVRLPVALLVQED